MEKIHIGKVVEKRLKEAGMSKSEFARRINRSRQNVNNILSRSSIDAELLDIISRVLDTDFFGYYGFATKSTYVAREKKTPYISKNYTENYDIEKEIAKIFHELEGTKKGIARLKEMISLLWKEKK